MTASGDKLLGGPQAGLICGTAELIAAVERHPLTRTVRASKVILAGLAATLRHYLHGEAIDEIPVWRMISTPDHELKQRAERMLGQLAEAGHAASLSRVESTIGGGALPGDMLPSWALAFGHSHVDELAQRLRTGSPGVFGRVCENSLLLDLRTVDPMDDQSVCRAILSALSESEAKHA